MELGVTLVGGASVKIPEDLRGSPDRTILTVAGAAASLLLHGLLVTPLLWGSYRHSPHIPPFQGASASRETVNSTEMALIIFSDSDAIHDLSSPDDQQTPVLMPPQIQLAAIGRPSIPTPEAVPDDANDGQAAEAQGDGGGHAMMFGRYVGQISARVERAWIRPRSSPGSGAFECRVQITQDRRGKVEEIALQECNDDLRWQASLVQAIQSASPFPAPPDPAVFSNLLTLQFDSEPYRPGGGDQGFEPVAQAPSVSNVPFQAVEHDKPVRVGFKETDRTTSTTLTIVGNRGVERAQPDPMDRGDTHREGTDRASANLAPDSPYPN
jgi:TonB C terminal